MEEQKSAPIKRHLPTTVELSMEPPNKSPPVVFQVESPKAVPEPSPRSLPLRKAKRRSNKVKIGDEVYSIGSCAYLKDRSALARIENIVYSEGVEAPFLEITWFYRRCDLEREGSLKKDENKFICDNEVFETNCRSKIPSDLIKGQCSIWSLHDYDKQPQVGLDDFYTRSHYDLVLVIVLSLSKMNRKHWNRLLRNGRNSAFVCSRWIRLRCT